MNLLLSILRGMRKALGSMPVYLEIMFGIFCLMPLWSLSLPDGPRRLFQAGMTLGIADAAMVSNYVVLPLLLAVTLLRRSLLFLPLLAFEAIGLLTQILVTSPAPLDALPLLKVVLIVVTVLLCVPIANRDFLFPLIQKKSRFWRKAPRLAVNKHLFLAAHDPKTEGEAGVKVRCVMENVSGTGLAITASAASARGFLSDKPRGSTIAVGYGRRQEHRFPVRLVWQREEGPMVLLGLRALDAASMEPLIDSVRVAPQSGVKRWAQLVFARTWVRTSARRTAVAIWSVALAFALGSPACGAKKSKDEADADPSIAAGGTPTGFVAAQPTGGATSGGGGAGAGGGIGVTPLPRAMMAAPKADAPVESATAVPATAVPATPVPTTETAIAPLPDFLLEATPRVVAGKSSTLSSKVKGAASAIWRWEQKSGPGRVTFNTAEAAETAVSADADGDYVVTVTAHDPEGRTASADVELIWDTAAPVVHMEAGDPSSPYAGDATELKAVAADATPMTFQWRKISGPGTLAFSRPTGVQTQMTASADGNYKIGLHAIDEAGNAADATFDLVWDTSAPEVSAGDDRVVFGAFTQIGAVSDLTPTTVAWTTVSGPDELVFANPTGLTSVVSAPAEGSYVARLTATDALGHSASSDVGIFVNAAAPQVSVGPDRAAGAAVAIGATVGNVNQPVYAWSQQSGPGTLAFAAAYALNTAVSATADGVYRVRMTATNEGGHAAFAEFNLTWDTSAPVVRIAPAGPAKAPVDLAGSVTDLSATNVRWSQVSGPGSAAFQDSSKASTRVGFDADGVYRLRLAATDALAHTASAEINILWDGHAPVIDLAGDTTTADPVAKAARVDDFSAFSVSWSQVSGPGLLSFSDRSALTTTISADTAGEYVLRLTATDALGNVGAAEASFRWTRFEALVDFRDAGEHTYDKDKVTIEGGFVSMREVQNAAPDDGAEDFAAGIADGVSWDEKRQALVLTPEGVKSGSGSYRSRIFDAGATADWSSIFWATGQDLPYQRDLPDGGATGLGFKKKVDMTGNIALFHFNEEASQAAFVDSSGVGANASCFEDRCPLAGRAGLIGGRAARFTAAKRQALIVPDQESQRPKGSLSISSWVMLATDVPFGHGYYIVEKGRSDAADSYALFFYNYPEMMLGFEYVDRSGTYQYLSVPVNAPLEKWMHVAVVVDDAAQKVFFYINGVAQNSGGLKLPGALNSENKEDLRIGMQNYGGADFYFDGWIDELALFARALSPEEIGEQFSRGAARVELQVRTCQDKDCGKDPDFVGPTGKATSVFTSVPEVGMLAGLSANRYFQYQATLRSDFAVSPALRSVSTASLPAGSSAVISKVNHGFARLEGFYEQLLPGHIGTLKYQLSTDGKTWFRCEGAKWVAVDDDETGSAAAAVNAAISGFKANEGVEALFVKTILSREDDTGVIRLAGVRIAGVE